ncbi:HAD-like domain-containing protein [Blastocladiella britannica]|nr:HAD-like domain-containing protein [Blastocladiella britannica]
MMRPAALVLARAAPAVKANVSPAAAAAAARSLSSTPAVRMAADNNKPPMGLSDDVARALLGRIDPIQVPASQARDIDGRPVTGPPQPEEGSDGQQQQQQRSRPRRPASANDGGLSRLQTAAVAGFFASVFAGTAWMLGRPDDDIADNGSMSPGAFVSRATTRTKKAFTSLSAPVYDKLLPDPLPAIYQRPYTLVINLNDTMIHTSWDAQHGWRIAKRPDLDYFLGYLSRYYEIVVFTRSPGATAQPVIDQIDAYQAISYRLYKGATTYKDGHHIKDITHLNRDPAKVIVMDWDTHATSMQPENALTVEKWDGSANVRSIKAYIPFLEMLALSNTPDVRPVLKMYAGSDVPVRFADRQAEYRRRLADEMRRADEEAAKPHHNQGGDGASAGTGLRALLGGASSRMALQHQQQQQVDMHRHAQVMQKQFEDEAALLKAEVERSRVAQEEAERKFTAARSQKTTLLKVIMESMDPDFQRQQQMKLQAAMDAAALDQQRSAI